MKVAIEIAVVDGRRVLRRGATTVAHTPELEAWLAAQAVGTAHDVECDYVRGRGLVARAPGASIERIAPDVEIGELLQRSRFAQALEELARLGEERVVNDAALLTLRVRARAAANEPAAARMDFMTLSRLPGVTARQMMRAYESARGEREMVAWVEAHLDDPAREHPLTTLLGDVPVASWSRPVAVRACEEALRRTHTPPAYVQRWLARAQELSADRASLARLAAAVEQYSDAYEQRATLAAHELLASRPSFAAIEARFGVTLPGALRAAWSRAYEGNDPYRFLVGKRGSPESLERLAGALADEQGYTLPATRLRYPMLPFATGARGSDYLVLDLTRPGDGDFPVRNAIHNVVWWTFTIDPRDPPEQVFATSQAFLDVGRAELDDVP